MECDCTSAIMCALLLLHLSVRLHGGANTPFRWETCPKYVSIITVISHWHITQHARIHKCTSICMYVCHHNAQLMTKNQSERARELGIRLHVGSAQIATVCATNTVQLRQRPSLYVSVENYKCNYFVVMFQRIKFYETLPCPVVEFCDFSVANRLPFSYCVGVMAH